VTINILLEVSIWVGHYKPLELFCLWTKVEGVVLDEVFFQTFDMSIISGDIRDQSRKLSEIAPKFFQKNIYVGWSI